MKERPILFSGAMVRALLAGTKTQTRRVAKGVHIVHEHTGEALARLDSAGPRIPCPYGQPGDRLWVREAWRSTGDGGRADYMPPRDMQPHPVWYEADGVAPPDEGVGKYRPPMFMPRWASRIALEITSVRAERLQAISEADAQAEGTTPIPDPCDHVRLACAEIGCSGPQPYRTGFRALWEQINGPASWDTNPWVWVVSFQPL